MELKAQYRVFACNSTKPMSSLSNGILAGLISFVVCIPAAVQAHPHAWIDFEVTILTDDAGMVTGIDENWLFDDFYTAFIASEIVQEGGDIQQGLIEVGRENLANLKEFNYFADLQANGSTRDLHEVERFETGVANDRLWLRFELELREPVDPETQRFTYTFYDPTYYVEVLHVEGHVPAVAGRLDCSVAIAQPNPSPEVVALAYSSEQDVSASDTLARIIHEALGECRRTHCFGL